jgi:hypothetical protein
VAAASSKQSVRSSWRTRLSGVSAVGVFLIAGVLRGGSLAVHSWILAAIGALLFAGRLLCSPFTGSMATT